MTGILLPLSLAGPAAVLEPVIEAHGLAWAGNQDGAPDPGGGLGATLGLRAQGWLDGEILAEAVGTRDADTELHLLTGASLRLVSSGQTAPALWLTGGMGAAVRGAVRPVLSLGGRLEVPLANPYLIRIEGRLLMDPSSGVLGGALTVGPALLKRAPTMPTPMAASEPVQVWPEAAIWMDHPHCGWHDPAETPGLIERYGPSMPVELHADGYLRMSTTLAEVADARLTRAPPQGALIVVGHPGDVLEIGGASLETDDEGVAVLNAAVGPIEIVGIGGGQQIRIQAAISRHHATWVRVPGPGITTIDFAVNSASLTPQDRLALLRLGLQAGGWSFALQGFSSPEGDADDNLVLADQRTDAVERVLRETGLSPDQILRLPAAIGNPDRMENWGRIVQLQPVAPGASP